MSEPLCIAFLGCGFITRVHSRILTALRRDVACSYASRDQGRAEAYRRKFAGTRTYPDYGSAIADPAIDAVVVAVPPQFHFELTLQALAAGKHVIVEKPAFPRTDDYLAAIRARDRAAR